MEDSGVPVLFYRMANALALAFPKLEISVIDYKDGSMARNILPLQNLKLIVFEKNKKVSPPLACILVMQTFVPYYWPIELVLNENQKIFFWNLHPQNLIPSLLPLSFLRDIPFNNFSIYKMLSNLYPKLFRGLQKYVQLLVEKDAIYFMDKSNYDYTNKYLFINLKKVDYIPVPVAFEKKDLTNVSQTLGSTINIGWIGRLCDFKSYILVYAINKLSEIAPKFEGYNFVFHVVGDGPFLAYIKNNVVANNQVSVIYHGGIPHQELDRFIATNLDIVTAMGTSALEGAKLRKPTILLDATFKKVDKDYVFRLLHETKEYDLAHFITEADYLMGNDSLFEIINKIISNYDVYAKKAEDYFSDHHDLINVKDLFLQKVNETKLEYSMIDPVVLRKGRILQFYNKIRGLEN